MLGGGGVWEVLSSFLYILGLRTLGLDPYQRRILPSSLHIYRLVCRIINAYFYVWVSIYIFSFVLSLSFFSFTVPISSVALLYVLALSIAFFFFWGGGGGGGVQGCLLAFVVFFSVEAFLFLVLSYLAFI